MSNQSGTSKRVHIEIIGGDADGLNLDSQSDDPIEREQVTGILALTNNCEIGKGIRGLSITKLRAALEGRAGVLVRLIRWPGFKYEYEVIERMEEENEVLIRMRYLGKTLPFVTKPETKQ